MHEAKLYRRLSNRIVECGICQRLCKIPEGKSGYCKTRKNKDGNLYSLIYGRVSTIRVSPIEIKPLFHFYPGSLWLSLGSIGCNFLCPGCQNWVIAHADVEKKFDKLRYIEPEELVFLAKEENCKGISWTYNEPTLWFEYTLDCARLAHKSGLLINYVTNAFITTEALDVAGPFIDAYRADLKGFSNDTYRRIANVKNFTGILDVLIRAKNYWHMHLEIITNLIPGINDGEEELKEMARWIHDELGEETPWHVTAFVPHFRWSHFKPTPVSLLEKAREIGLEAGLKYVYLGNVPGHPAENTHCPECGHLLIERADYKILQYNLNGNKCEMCGNVIEGVFESP